MREAGIEPDIVCGRLNELRQWAEAATWREVIGLLDVRLAGGGLISGMQLGLVLSKLGRGELELRRLQYSKPHRRGNRPTTGRRGVDHLTHVALAHCQRADTRSKGERQVDRMPSCLRSPKPRVLQIVASYVARSAAWPFRSRRLPPSKSLI